VEETKNKFPYRQAIPLWSEIEREEILEDAKVGLEVVASHPTLRVINSVELITATTPISPSSLKAALLIYFPGKDYLFIKEIAGEFSFISKR
jgi:hypothetical protein